MAAVVPAAAEWLVVAPVVTVGAATVVSTAGSPFVAVSDCATCEAHNTKKN